ncbi:MAG: hypothetical protein LKK08_06330 [Bacteroidales bacterium]|jgi:hypothetical protein|nr:hypothetical protein [Bacteroidales bacterium]
MALSATKTKTAWGDLHLYLSVMGDSDAMGTAWADVGSVSPDNFSIETTAGDKYELKDINGKLLDLLKLEPSLAVKFTLINPTEETKGKFWTITEDTTDATARKIKVTSLVNNTATSFKLANPKAIGSDTFEAAKTYVNMDLDYQKDKGWLGTCEVDLVWPDRDDAEMFQFGTVAAAA